MKLASLIVYRVYPDVIKKINERRNVYFVSQDFFPILQKPEFVHVVQWGKKLPSMVLLSVKIALLAKMVLIVLFVVLIHIVLEKMIARHVGLVNKVGQQPKEVLFVALVVLVDIKFLKQRMKMITRVKLVQLVKLHWLKLPPVIFAILDTTNN